MMKRIHKYINEKLVLNKDNIKDYAHDSVYDWLKVNNFVFYMSWDTPENKDETFNDTLVITCGKIYELTDDNIKITLSDYHTTFASKICTELNNYKILNDNFVFCSKLFRQYLLINDKLFDKIINDYFLKERIINLEDLIDLKDINYSQKEYQLKEPTNFSPNKYYYDKIIKTIKNNNINEKLVLNKGNVKDYIGDDRSLIEQAREAIDEYMSKKLKFKKYTIKFCNRLYDETDDINELNKILIYSDEFDSNKNLYLIDTAYEELFHIVDKIIPLDEDLSSSFHTSMNLFISKKKLSQKLNN